MTKKNMQNLAALLAVPENNKNIVIFRARLGTDCLQSRASDISGELMRISTGTVGPKYKRT